MTASKQEAVRDLSPIEKLNEKLESNNGDLVNLLERLTEVGSRISANNPDQKSDADTNVPAFPFNEGILMAYLYKLNLQEELISKLRSQVLKLEQLF